MLMAGKLPELRLMPVERVCIHEGHEPSRLDETCRAIAAEGVLRHPLLGTLMADGRALILDGAHRTQALRELGCVRLPVQWVEPRAFSLEAWTHLVPKGPWLTELRRNPSLRWSQAVECAGRLLAEVVDDAGVRHPVHAATPERDILSILPAWQRVVEAYTGTGAVRRVPDGAVHHPEPGMVLLRYPACPLEEVEAVVSAGRRMPPGVTRFVVQGRYLNLRIPLELLRSPADTEAEWKALVAHRLGALRFYAEGVYLCEA
ncbi:ParB N-terminal domain-containing protein [Pyxidicoccus xibeiensis]|nr:ParB N-terminal domain-containing protein [Pyxidicoccus xibeiensis]